MRAVVIASLIAATVVTTSALGQGVPSECTTDYLQARQGSTNLNFEAINGILTSHNEARRRVTPYAAIMPMLQWDENLATYAQEIASTCKSDHTTSDQRTNETRFGFYYVGENLAQYTSSGDVDQMKGNYSTNLWNSEIQFWNYSTGCAPGQVCGHYTQNIWAGTTKIGCGVSNCMIDQRQWTLWRCIYGSGGNYQGQNPYREASSLEGSALCTFNRSLATTTGNSTNGTTTAPATTTKPTGNSTYTTTTITTKPTGNSTTGGDGTTTATTTTTTKPSGNSTTGGDGTTTATTTTTTKPTGNSNYTTTTTRPAGNSTTGGNGTTATTTTTKPSGGNGDTTTTPETTTTTTKPASGGGQITDGTPSTTTTPAPTTTTKPAGGSGGQITDGTQSTTPAPTTTTKPAGGNGGQITDGTQSTTPAPTTTHPPRPTIKFKFQKGSNATAATLRAEIAKLLNISIDNLFIVPVAEESSSSSTTSEVEIAFTFEADANGALVQADAGNLQSAGVFSAARVDNAPSDESEEDDSTTTTTIIIACTVVGVVLVGGLSFLAYRVISSRATSMGHMKVENENQMDQELL